ncbi:hypothetical protein SAMN05444920_101600 [Nonomuraea solani]|uniref:Uncharacterized protein n=2 Tax=Nonomuraea solani TaxID=1144553 RepID=A0A1H5UPS1_9ACTN|nr:hypothetical protein SAMN05444920_101600 [Nonomuraea solani]
MEYRVDVSGGEVSGAIAMGPGARATVNNVGARGEAGPLLDRLERLLGEHAADLPEAAQAGRDVEDVRRELEQAEPDRSRILDALKRLSVRAAEVSVIVEVVSQIRALFP